MAASPVYKIFSGKTYLASAKVPDLAVRIAALMENGNVKFGHGETIYRHGIDGDANESIDRATLALMENERNYLQRCYDKR